MELLGGDLVLMRESAEDLFPADPVVGEVDRRWPRVSLSWCELAEGAVRPGAVVMPQVLGQHLAQVVLIDDQQPVQELPARVPMTLSQIAFALGACGGVARILIPSAWNTASKEPVNWPARSLIRNLMEAALAEVHQEVTGCLGCPRGIGIRGDAREVNAAGAV